MMTWAEKIEARGYSLGHQEGRREGEAALLLRMAERKLGQVTPEARRRIEGAQPDQLLAWGERLMTAESLDETFRDREASRR